MCWTAVSAIEASSATLYSITSRSSTPQRSKQQKHSELDHSKSCTKLHTPLLQYFLSLKTKPSILPSLLSKQMQYSRAFACIVVLTLFCSGALAAEKKRKWKHPLSCLICGCGKNTMPNEDAIKDIGRNSRSREDSKEPNLSRVRLASSAHLCIGGMLRYVPIVL